MDLLPSIINGVLVAVVGLLVAVFVKEISSLRSDVTQLALALGTPPQPQAG